ncbi:MAG: glycosyltransferase family 39 protein [Bdellovibrionales bacterium]|nr:glycosyltransferase family 39 protein [Bdellovibrionales bacterium]
MFWSDLAAFRPGMDSMTYGAISRHMALHGDWFVPHYTTQAYPNFFQHPPFALWMMALSMKLFALIGGPETLYADWVLKALPALIAGLCAIGVYLWGKRIRDESFAFLATLVLLTSTRFAKYSKGFMLDPFLATFSLWGVYAACLARKKPSNGTGLAALAGLSIAAAMLSKGLFAFGPLAVILAVYGLDLIQLRSGTVRIVAFLAGLGLPLAAWFVFGDASNYLHHYYSEHVADRIGPHPLIDHFAPIINLAKVYWPWLPFFAIGCWRVLRNWKDESKRDELAIGLTALAFVGGFCVVASFLEQYHTATYPFAALVAAIGFPSAWEKFRAGTEKILLAVCLGFFVFLLLNPYSMQGTEYKNPIRLALKEADRRCADPAIRRITISTGVAEIWYALAIGGWNTRWDPHSAPATELPKNGSQLLLAAANEHVPSAWTPAGIEAEGLRLYRATDIGECSPSTLLNAASK